MGTWKRCSDWLDRSYFTPLGNQFWIAIELIVSHTSVCRVGYFDAQIRETALYKQGAQFTLLLGVNITNHLQGTDITKQLAFLAIPSHCFWLNQLIFTVLHFWVLDRSFVHSTPPFGGKREDDTVRPPPQQTQARQLRGRGDHRVRQPSEWGTFLQ